MKKLILPALMLACLFVSAQDDKYGYRYEPEQKRQKPASTGGPKNRINLYGAYVFDDNVNNSYDSYNYFDGTVKGGFQYGAGLEFMVREDYGVELLWIGQVTTVPMVYSYSYYSSFANYATFDLNLNYAMLAFGGHMQRPGSNVEGYGGLMLGCLFANAKNPDNGSDINAEKFAWGLRLGGTLWASERIGLKIQAQLLSAIQSAGGSLYFGTGGYGGGVYVYAAMYQFSIGGGLAFKIGR